ncbi:MAG: repeat containing protein [Verrucomicrobiales bacterium]|nr:repeat containing protein [Verrucomicrobiales bacterium]
MKKFFLLSVAVLLALLPTANAQNLSVSTLAGNAGQTSADGTTINARFNNPWGVTVDASGNVYVADTDSHIIRKITSAGVVSTFAGTVGISGTNDATGTSATFNSPQGIVIDATGNLYVTDTGNHTVRKITSLGVVSTLAGAPTISGTTDGNNGNARFNQPEGIAINAAGTILYVADTANHTIRSVTVGGSVITYAGTAGTPGSANLTGTSASFNTPQGVAVDSSGSVYVADTGNQLIRLISAGGVVSTFAGVSGTIGSNDGATGTATFWDPLGVAVSGSTVYVADSFNNTIRKISAGSVSTPAGSAGVLGSADGNGANARFWQPQGIAVDISSNVYIADGANGTIRKIIGTTVSTLAGSPSIGSADGNASTARFFFPGGVAIDSSGNNYVADTQNNTIRTVTSAGIASTLVGTVGVSGSADGNGTSAQFNAPQGIAKDSLASAYLYVADTGNHTIRRISGTTVTLFAGTAGTSGVADGTGSAAQFNSPQDVALDSSGNIFVADTWNHTIRKITTAGVVTAFAGVPGAFGDSDGTGANVGTNGARFYAPGGVAVDGSGNVFVADTYNHTVRKITSAGVVSTIAGLGGYYGTDDGTNGNAHFFFPRSVSVDATGNVYVLDSGNHTVRKLTASGTNWIVTTVAGTANLSGSAKGVGGAARFFAPTALDINASGTFAIADLGNNSIRSAVSGTGSAPTITSQPQSQTVVSGQTASFSVTATGIGTLTYQWYFNTGLIGGATTSSYTKVNAQTTDAGSYSVTVSNTGGPTASANAILTVNVAPAITAGPQSQTVNAGTSPSFSVTATGTAPLSYQWFFGAAAISGATTSSYTVANAQAANVGNYSVVVTNVAGTATSGSAALSVTPVGPSITSQPQSQAVGQSSSATFSVTASGSTPFSYQWLFNNGVINGATSSSYTIANAQQANTGSYSVVVTNNYGSATSDAATLSILVPPIISTQPQGQLARIGSNVTFTVGLSQGTNVAYQWKLNGNAVSGATLSSYSISSVQWTNAGSYSVVVTNGAGTATRSNAILAVQQAVQTFFDNFESYNLGFVDNNTSGGPNATPASNPWWSLSSSTGQGLVTNASTGVTPHSGAQMLGVTPGLTIRQDYFNLIYRMNSGVNYYGNFMCEWWFYDPYGSNSSGATNMQEYIALNASSPVPTTSDTTTSFSAINQRMSLGMYNGNVGYSYSNYQARIIGGTGGTFGSGNSWYNTATTRSIGWHHARIVAGIPTANVAPISMYIDDMTNATIFSATVATNGFDLIELNHEMQKANFYGYYDDLTFHADNDPWIVEQPKDATVVASSSTTLTTVAVGTGYQWRLNGTAIGGATSSAYTIVSTQGSDAGSYTCAITGTNGTVTTSAAVITVFGVPTINSQPTSQTVNQGQNATFSVAASGFPPLSYQWSFNNSTIGGATSSSYTVQNATAGNVGTYTVVATNPYGTATSSPATLTVIPAPAITSQPSSLTVLQGATANFSVTATGSGLTYQWRFNGTPIANATGTSYQKSGVQLSDAGGYSVVVSNTVGTVTSSNASLTVVTATTALNSITANPDNSISMIWQVAATTNYTLQSKTNLLDAQWNTLNNFSPSGSTLTVSDGPVADVQRTYQLASAQGESELGGFLRLTLLGNSDNIVSIPFGRAPAISLLVGSTSGNVITASSSPGWTANQFVYSSGTQSNNYFVRFTSGGAVGRIYPITANGANTLTVNLGTDSLAAVAQNDSFAIEAYWTLNTVFPNGAGVNVSPTVGNRNTEVLIPDLATSGINLSASKIYFFNAGIWKQVGQGGASHNDDILQPNAFLIVRHNVATNTVLTTVGRVISSPITMTVVAQSSVLQDNCIGLQRPVPVSLNDSGLISSGAFNASPVPGSRTDELLTFDNSVVARNKSSSASYYYWSGAWRQVGAGSADVGANQIFQPGNGVIIRKGTNNVSSVWTNTPTWTQ